jgi:PilZ domain
MQAESYNPALLAVSMYGTDAEGKPFYQITTAQAVNEQSAVLNGVECQLRPGEIVGIQYQEKKTRARVLWLCEQGPRPKMQVGVQLVPGAGCPWRKQVETTSTELRVALPPERRVHPRHKLAIGVELLHRPSDTKIRAQTSDISLGGCYVETTLRLPVGAELNVTLWIESKKWELDAVVRSSHPSFGMGLEFIDLSEAQRSALASYLDSRTIPVLRK